MLSGIGQTNEVIIMSNINEIIQDLKITRDENIEALEKSMYLNDQSLSLTYKDLISGLIRAYESASTRTLLSRKPIKKARQELEWARSHLLSLNTYNVVLKQLRGTRAAKISGLGKLDSRHDNILEQINDCLRTGKQAYFQAKKAFNEAIAYLN